MFFSYKYLDFFEFIRYNYILRGEQMSEFKSFQHEVIEKIRRDLESYRGSRMKFRTNLGRCRIVERIGILEETHPNLFVIKLEEPLEKSRRISYSYADILIKTVELSHPLSGENLFPWLH